MKYCKEITEISFTKFVDANKKTAKSYDLLDGSLIKATNGCFWSGLFETINIKTLDLPDFIESLVPGEFLIQGVHQSLSKGSCPEEATRLKDTFPFTDYPGLFCIDTDSAQKLNIHSLEELNDALSKIEPSLSNVMKVMSTSASSYISVDGKEINGLRGIHTFIPIDTTINNKSILEALHVRSVIAGYGYAKVTSAGTIKINSIIDKALCTSNQPIFEGGAILRNESITQKRKVKTFEGKLLSAESIPPLTQEEINSFEKITADLKAKVAEEAQQTRNQYLNQYSQRMKEKISHLTEKNAVYIINQAITNQKLHGEFLILLETGEEITVQNIIDNPLKYHQVSCTHPLDESVFGKSMIYSDQDKPLIHTFDNGGEVFYLSSNYKEELLADWEVQLNDHVDFFNKTHAQVIIGGKHKIMRTVPAGVHQDSRISYEFINQEELRKIHANDRIQVAEKFTSNGSSPVMKDKITAWSNHSNCRTYRGGVVFAPGKIFSADYYNTWQGFAVEPFASASTDIIKKHIENIICANNKALVGYFYDWVAYTMQYPNRPAGSALVLRGEKGSGKGMIGHFLRRIWGDHSIHISNAMHLVGKFNGHLSDVCFLFADEAFYSGDKQHEGVLKALITDPTLTIERKGIDAISQPNYLKIFMVTNSDYAVQATKDERRYCVFDVASFRIGDKGYFDTLNAACNDKSVQSTFLYEMLNRDISNFSVSAIPESQGLKDQRLSSLKSPGKWLVDSFTQGHFAISYDCECKWENEVSSANLYKSYKLWCDSQRLTQYEIVNQNAFGKYLAKIFTNKKLKGDVRGFVFGSLSTAISTFEKYEKVNLEIDSDEKPVCINEWDGCISELQGEEIVIPVPSARANNRSIMGCTLN